MTRSETTCVSHIGYRAKSQEALERRIAEIKTAGYDGEWVNGDLGHGPAYRFQSPAGHNFEIYFQTRRYKPDIYNRPSLKNMVQRYHGQGCSPRHIDHLNLLAPCVESFEQFMITTLGSKVTEKIVLDEGSLAGSWFTVNNKTYDLACTCDHTGVRARFHHLAYATDQREDILRAADIFLENNIHIETGPHKHAIQGTFYLYVWEPSGNRVELANSGARLLLAPDWETIVWTETERKKGQAWGLRTIESFHTYGTPPV